MRLRWWRGGALAVVTTATMFLAACGEGEVERTATPTEGPTTMVVEGLSCQDFYPGIQGPVAHRISAQGHISNPGDEAVAGALIEILFESAGGENSRTLEPDEPTATIPAGGSIPFYASEDMTTEDPSFTNGTCRVVVRLDGREVQQAAGSEAAVEGFYAP